jgi:hypothetical protein
MSTASGQIAGRPHVARRAAVVALLASLGLWLGGCATASRPVVPQPVTVEQIVQMSKEKMPPDEIIRKMRNSGTVYRLRASQLARLRDEGVSDQVIDYMQHTYLAAVRRSARLEGWGYWYHATDGFWYGGVPFGWPYYWYWPDEFFWWPDAPGMNEHEQFREPERHEHGDESHEASPPTLQLSE